ncbi:MAG: AbrB/MazE/SpoVT family DNA-binding domain-containing protein [Rhodospirillaceae bacterium]|nr:AbrB/MazE/SpoVT family DNA-binding domain-containing protein [Rhodospirillales bacterium]
MRDQDAVTTVMMSDKGRVIVPASIRRGIGMSEGGKVVVRVTERGTVELVPFEVAVAEMRSMVRSRLSASPAPAGAEPSAEGEGEGVGNG